MPEFLTEPHTTTTTIMAAAAESTQIGQSFSPQEILQEVRKFLLYANYKVQNQRQREALAQSALILLRTLPTARHAVLEYLANMFDEAVNNYLLEMDLGQNVTDASHAVMENLLQDASGVLHTFIQTNSVAWAPIISTWSLELLGHISSKYSDRRGVPHTGSLNELLQLWLTCKPTKLLIEVATECFAQMVGGAPENCVDALLEASVKYSPHFDWVVAHIGSCFPRTIIMRVLMCGLKDYCHHGHHVEGAGDSKIPKMGSVVGILGHLASRHGHDIKDALMKLFQESLGDTGMQPRVTTLPFLLQLASMSPLLLHILATDLVKALTAPVLSRLHALCQPWMASYPHEFDSMMSLVVHLVMRCDTGADKVLEFIIYNATATRESVSSDVQLPLPEVQKTCSVLLDQVLNETQSHVFRRSRDNSGIDVPFLGALSSKLSHLVQDMLNSTGKRSNWLRRLICYIILYKGARHGAETLAFILSQAKSPQELSQLVHIQQNVEVGIGGVLASSVQLAMDMLHHQKDVDQHQLLNNIYSLTQWESTSPPTLTRCTFKVCLKPYWASISQLLLHTDQQVSMVALKLLNYVGVPSTLSSGEVLKVCGALTTMFFQVLEIQDASIVNSMVNACKQCAHNLCTKQYSQSIMVRYLIESAINEENRLLFGGKIGLGTAKLGSRDSHTSLREENKSHGVSLTTLRSHSSVLHAGVIGPGLRKISDIHKLTQDMVSRNCMCLLEMLWTCSQEIGNQSDMPTDSEEQREKTQKSYRLEVCADMCRMIGSLIVEIATPDVLYNNRFWPEEESLKMTVERDLHVWKVFDDNPVLWQILQMFASNTLIIARTSTVFKSLTATMMHHFELSREKTASNSPKQMECTCHIVRCLGKSGLLPHPLGILSELFPFVNPHEAFLLLLVVWRYMKENPPTEDPSEVTRRVCDTKHLDVVRSIAHKHIHTAGELYGRFFSPPPPIIIPMDS